MDKYDRKAIPIALGVFVVVAVLDVASGAGIAWWIDAFVFAAAAFNISAFVFRRRAGIPFESYWVKLFRKWRSRA